MGKWVANPPSSAQAELVEARSGTRYRHFDKLSASGNRCSVRMDMPAQRDYFAAAASCSAVSAASISRTRLAAGRLVTRSM